MIPGPFLPSSWSPGWFALAAESMPEVMITERYLALRAPFESLVGMEGDSPVRGINPGDIRVAIRIPGRDGR